jgi:hypothetical protein
MSGKSNNLQKVIRLQRRILSALKAEAESLLGHTPESILSYARENRNDFDVQSRKLKKIPKSELIRIIRDQDITFIGDFHTFDQAQNAALRIARETIRTNEKWIFGLEMIPSQFQKELDQFQQGKLSLSEFHNILSYQHEWGFPWKHYAPIFNWAREQGVRLIALNRPKGIFKPEDDQELHERDLWAAGIITDLFASRTRHSRTSGHFESLRMLVLYGELHVGSRHLPARVKKLSQSYMNKSLKCAIIHQNDDSLYWKASREKLNLQTAALHLKKDIYCIFSGTPWAKLQSLMSWTEDGPEDVTDTETEFHSQDYLHMIRTYGTTISEFLNLPPPSYEALNVYTAEQPDFIDPLRDSKIFSPLELKLVEFHIFNNRYCYIPKIAAAYLGSSSHNAAAELAAVHLLRVKSRSKIFYSNQLEDFYRLILESCFGFFGSLIINPMRKCDFLKDHIKRVEQLNQGDKPSFPFEKEARELLIVEFKYPLKRGNSREKLLNFSPKQAPVIMTAARYVGRILGKQLYLAVLSERVMFETVKGHFLSRTNDRKDCFQVRYETLRNVLSQVEINATKTDYF